MSDVAFPSKEEADELTLNELMQAIAMAGVWVDMYGGSYIWQAKISGPGFISQSVRGNQKDTPRAALDSACEAWRKEAE